MGLNIKNERVHALARQAARVTGRSQTSAIELALERLLAEYGADPAAQRTADKIDMVTTIVDAYIEDPGNPAAIRRPEDLYDTATGFPR